MEVGFEQSQVLMSVFGFAEGSNYDETDESFREYMERVGLGDQLDFFYDNLIPRLGFILETGIAYSSPARLNSDDHEPATLEILNAVFTFSEGSHYKVQGRPDRNMEEYIVRYDEDMDIYRSLVNEVNRRRQEKSIL